MRLTSFIIFMFSCSVSYGQIKIESVLNTSGGSATLSAVHLEWNVGEMTSVDLYSAGTTIVTAGLLQGNVSTPTSVLYINLPANAVAFYPNPVAQNLNGSFRFNRSGDLYVRILNVKGQTLYQWKWQVQEGQSQKQFLLDELAGGTYFTEVIFVPSAGVMQKGTYTIIKL
jgi:hypothetical protein